MASRNQNPVTATASCRWKGTKAKADWFTPKTCNRAPSRTAAGAWKEMLENTIKSCGKLLIPDRCKTNTDSEKCLPDQVYQGVHGF